MSRSVTIIGGGISGTGLALALYRLGFSVKIYEREQQSSLREVGLVLTPDALEVLDAYQVTQDLIQRGPSLTQFIIRDLSGNRLISLPLQDNARGRGPLAIHRSVLLKALQKRLPAQTFQFGREFQSFRNEGQQVIAQFRDGSEVCSDVLIGADGMRSQVGNQMAPSEPLNYSGYVLWSGISDRCDLVQPGTLFESSGAGHRFGATNIGGGQIYWYACVNVPPHTHFGTKTREELVLRFIRFHSPVAALIEGTSSEQIYTQPCYGRNPLKSWSRDHVALIGEAAHPMASDLGQGTCQGLEDGLVLARCLDASADLESALRHYEQHRAPRTASAQRALRLTGRLGQMEHPLACTLRNFAFRYTPRFSIQRHYRQLLGNRIR